MRYGTRKLNCGFNRRDIGVHGLKVGTQEVNEALVICHTLYRPATFECCSYQSGKGPYSKFILES